MPSTITRLRRLRLAFAHVFVGGLCIGCGGNDPPPRPATIAPVASPDAATSAAGVDQDQSQSSPGKGKLVPVKPPEEDPEKKATAHEMEAAKALQALGAALQMNDQGHVVFINLLNHPRCDDAAMESLKALPHLVGLDLRGTKITNQGLAVVGAVTSLEELYLGETAVGDSGLESLLALSRLKVLNLVSTKNPHNTA